MKSLAHLVSATALVYAVMHYGLPDRPPRLIHLEDFSVELAALALLALAGSLYVALRRMKP